MQRTRPIFALSVAALLMAGCGSDDKKDATTAAIEPLDPTAWNYGGRYSDWAGQWWKWLLQVVPTADCGEPVGDTTGELCALGQDPTSQVFFLVGTWGSTVTRTKCVVPQGKALFFPVVASSADNGGVPEDSLQTDEQLRARVATDFGNMPTAKLSLSIDGRQIANLDRLAVQAAPYEYTLPPSPNMYDCLGAPDVTGTYPGYTSGYYALLAPLPPGDHTLEYGGTVESTDPFVTQARYDPLKIQ
jgi:hypothetical protein